MYGSLCDEPGCADPVVVEATTVDSMFCDRHMTELRDQDAADLWLVDAAKVRQVAAIDAMVKAMKG